MNDERGAGAGDPFGNPESNTGRSRNSAPVAELRGDELGIRNGESLQDAAKRYYDGLTGLPAERQGFGAVGFYKESGWKKMKSTSLSAQEKLKLLPAVKPMIEHGDYIGRADAGKNRKDRIVAFHYFEGNVKVAEAVKFVGVSVGEDNTGKKFYNLTEDPDALLKKKKARELAGDSARGREPLGTPQAKPLAQV